jgi:hypothetical protein
VLQPHGSTASEACPWLHVSVVRCTSHWGDSYCNETPCSPVAASCFVTSLAYSSILKNRSHHALVTGQTSARIHGVTSQKRFQCSASRQTSCPSHWPDECVLATTDRDHRSYRSAYSPLQIVIADPIVSATSERHPGSVPLLRYSVPSAFPLEFPQLYQIFSP